MSQLNLKLETRGRPRKKQDEKLPSISRKLFSEHCAVFYACCMVYVLEIFLKTKQQKRIGHSQGGFTIYEKVNVIYCFESFEEDIKEWGYADAILENQYLYDFTKTVNGCAPKFVFKELVLLIVMIHNFIQREHINSIEELEANQTRILDLPEIELNKLFKYIRFTSIALKEIKMDKWNAQISKKMRDLWFPFLKIMSYTVFLAEKNYEKNKYLKPFFSDAEHPEETIIGQLNLEQIIEQKYCERYGSSSVNNIGFTKITAISKNIKEESDGLDHKIREFQCSPRSEKVISANKRPIMLITFPSIQRIDTQKESPSKISHPNSSATPDPKRSYFQLSQKQIRSEQKLQGKTEKLTHCTLETSQFSISAHEKIRKVREKAEEEDEEGLPSKKVKI